MTIDLQLQERTFILTFAKWLYTGNLYLNLKHKYSLATIPIFMLNYLFLPHTNRSIV